MIQEYSHDTGVLCYKSPLTTPVLMTDHGLGVAQHPAAQLCRASLAGVDAVAHRGHLGQVWSKQL